jgi:phosphinothricin acetyltransferase
MSSIAQSQTEDIGAAAPGAAFIVRSSREEDVPEMVAIYTHHIARGSEVAFDPVTHDDIKRRRKTMLRRRLPHIVADLDGKIIGYAFAVPFRKRPAYRYTVKHSIYVHHEHLHAGVGRVLIQALIDACAFAGYRQMIGYIDGSNAPSLQLHEAAGFRQVAYLPSIGFKYGRWTDSVMMQRALGEGDSTPPEQPNIRIGERDVEDVDMRPEVNLHLDVP